MERAWDRTRHDWTSWRKRVLWSTFGGSILVAVAYLGYQLVWGSERAVRAGLAAVVIAAGVFVVAGISAFVAIWVTSPHRVLRDAVVDHEARLATSETQADPEEQAFIGFIWQLRVLESDAVTLRQMVEQYLPRSEGHRMTAAFVDSVLQWRRKVLDVLVTRDADLAALWAEAVDAPLGDRVYQLHNEIDRRRNLLDRLITTYENRRSLLHHGGF